MGPEPRRGEPLILLWPLGGALLGALFGSFIATWTQRLGDGRSIGGRSRCDHCDAQIAARDLIPLLSHIVLRGQCRSCGGAIAGRHRLVELAALQIGLVALFAAPGWDGLAGAVFGWLLLALAITDVEQFRLPNSMTGLMALSGIAAGLSGLAPDLTARLIGGVAGFAALTLIALGYRLIRKRDGMGGGDPKMLGAIGLWLGWQALPLVLVAASAIGLIAVLIRHLRGQSIAGDVALPFGALLALAAFPIWAITTALPNLRFG